MRFDRYIGIDYSGARDPSWRIPGLQVYSAGITEPPTRIGPPDEPPGKRWNWNRRNLAEWIVEQSNRSKNFIIGIDHAFSFPRSYFQSYKLRDWDSFLADFKHHWPTHEDCNTVDSVGEEARKKRTGNPGDLRLTDRWTSSAKSVFQFKGQGQVGKSTHAGIPWLAHIRRSLPDVHFWPFDNWNVPEGVSVIAEVYPSIFKRRYTDAPENAHERDAYAVARWLREVDERQLWNQYFHPSLTEDERRIAELEGWILGVC